jgi:hypothetical protein
MLFHLYLLGKVSKKKLLGTARVLAYGTVVAAGLGALTVRSAVADVGTQSLELGRKLADLQDVIHGAQEFRLNGQTVFFSSTKSDEAVAAVLDRFEHHCDNARAFDALKWKTLADMKGTDIDKTGKVSRFGVLRKEDATVGDGVVMCFTNSSGPRDFLTSMQAFAVSGDLHDLGDVRYAHATRKDGSTTVQTMWTDGSFNIRSIIGTPGHDSIGSDFATLPRPIHATRTITAEALNTPYSARIYESTDAPDVVLQAYSDKMLADGWSSVTSPDVSLERMGFDGRYYVKGETAEQAVISVSKNDKDKTMIVLASVGQMPSTDHLHPVSQ